MQALFTEKPTYFQNYWNLSSGVYNSEISFFAKIMMAACGALYKALFIVLLTPCWILVGTSWKKMKVVGNIYENSYLLI